VTLACAPCGALWLNCPEPSRPGKLWNGSSKLMLLFRSSRSPVQVQRLQGKCSWNVVASCCREPRRVWGSAESTRRQQAGSLSLGFVGHQLSTYDAILFDSAARLPPNLGAQVDLTSLLEMTPFIQLKAFADNAIDAASSSGSGENLTGWCLSTAVFAWWGLALAHATAPQSPLASDFMYLRLVRGREPFISFILPDLSDPRRRVRAERCCRVFASRLAIRPTYRANARVEYSPRLSIGGRRHGLLDRAGLCINSARARIVVPYRRLSGVLRAPNLLAALYRA